MSSRQSSVRSIQSLLVGSIIACAACVGSTIPSSEVNREVPGSEVPPPLLDEDDEDTARSPGSTGRVARRNVEACFRYFAEQQDLFHRSFVVYDDRASGGSHFFPTGWMGSLAASTNLTTLMDDGFRESPAQGQHCTRIRFPPHPWNPPWIGVYWLPPDGWAGAGYDIRKYVHPGEEVDLRLSFRLLTGDEQVTFKVGGREGDSFGPVARTVVGNLSWTPVEFDLTGHDLSSVGGGLCFTSEARAACVDCGLDVDDVRIEFGPKGTRQRLNEPHFTRSYVPRPTEIPDRHFRSVAYLYDNALLALVLCARSAPDDLRRAGVTCDAIVVAQELDPEHDGRLRSGYSCGDLLDQRGVPSLRLAGWWNQGSNSWETDAYCASVDTGNLAWAMIALLTYAERCTEDARARYVNCATDIAEWVTSRCKPTSDACGFTGGEDWSAASTRSGASWRRRTWKSTEHNIDLFVAFERLASATGDSRWRDEAAVARRLVDRMRDPTDGHLYAGTESDGTTPIKSPIPIDVATWAVLAFPGVPEFATALRQAVRRCWYTDAANTTLCGSDFNEDRDGVWWEGTSQLAIASAATSDYDIERQCIESVRRHGTDPTSPGSVVAASMDGLSTGFRKEWGDWVYWKRPHIGATCWYVFAELSWNPYWARRVP